MRDWKRYEEAKRLRDTGLTLKATGAAPGVCGDTVRYMLASLERREKSRVWATENPSLVPWWWGLKHGTRWELEQRGIDPKCSSYPGAGSGGGGVGRPIWPTMRWQM